MVNLELIFFGPHAKPFLIAGILIGLMALFSPKALYEATDFKRDQRKYDQRYERKSKLFGVMLITISIIIYILELL